MGLHDRISRQGDGAAPLTVVTNGLPAPPPPAADPVYRAVTEELALDRTPLTREERREIVRQLTDDILGYGPLEQLLRDDTVTEIMVNAYDRVYVERRGKIERCDVRFVDESHVITLESRPANIEGKGEIRIRELVRNALRMRPDRIIVGEVRGAETLDMLQAMNTGHEGSLTTIHANSPRDALSRLETLVLTAGVDLPLRAIREQIASAFDLLVQISRLVDGSRRVTHVTEVLRMESDVITLQDIFVAKPPDEETSSMSRSSRLLAPLSCTGLKPHFLEKSSANGVTLPPAFCKQDE